MKNNFHSRVHTLKLYILVQTKTNECKTSLHRYGYNLHENNNINCMCVDKLSNYEIIYYFSILMNNNHSLMNSNI